MTSQEKEHRGYPRIELSDVSKIHIAHPPRPTLPLDISLQGLRIRTVEPLDPGMEVNVYLFNQTLECKATVRWVNPVSHEGECEAGLQLQYPDSKDYQEMISHLPKFSRKLNLLILTPIELSTRAIGKYFDLLNIAAVAVSTPDKVLESLTEHPWDLLALDMALDEAYPLIQNIAAHPISKFLPILVLTPSNAFHSFKLQMLYPFLEIFPKPAHAHELFRRAILLLEQTSRYLTAEQSRKQAEKQLTSMQQTLAQHNEEMLKMLSQVMQQSESLGQLIQLQEAWLGLETFDQVVEFAQQWAKENFNIFINVWHCEGENCLPLGENCFDHPKFDQQQRTTKIQELLRQRVHILHGDPVLIRKNEWVLEIVSDLSNSDLIDTMTFLMKVLAPVFVTKRLESALRQTGGKAESVVLGSCSLG